MKSKTKKKKKYELAFVLVHTYIEAEIRINKAAKLFVYVIISIDKKTMSAKHESNMKEICDTGKLLIQ